MKLARRVQQLPPYLFVGISRAIAEKKRKGIDVISFGIGDPDIPTPSSVLDSLEAASRNPLNHRYPESEGLPAFRSAVARWYKRRFDVELDAETQALNLIGAKEGIGHAALCFINPGDIALVPDPGYPVYSIGTAFCGGDSYFMPLKEENAWIPDLDAVPSHVLKRAKVMWLNYPNNPTGATVSLNFFERAVEFAKLHDIALLHDACYSEVTFDSYSAPSVLQVPGALDVAVEFHSMSKTYNMTGWRIGMAAGNAEMIDALMRVKSNLDSGAPQAIQEMGVAALELPESWVTSNNQIYRRRRDMVVDSLKSIGLDPISPKAGLYVWTNVPQGFSSAQFAQLLLDDRDIVVTPGTGYGLQGEGYIRLSLTTPDDRIEEGLGRLEGWKIPPIAHTG